MWTGELSESFQRKNENIQRTHELYYNGWSIHEQLVNDDTPQVCTV